MGQRRKWRILMDAFKDKSSIIKVAMSARQRSSSALRIAILRATTHDVSTPPSEKRIAAVLSLGSGSRLTACSCIDALMDRLQGTSNVSVALKCLFTIHNIITNGSFILKDQLSFYPSFGGRNFLNVSTFRDDSDAQTWELSSWVRWYAGILEENLIMSRILGYYLSSSSLSTSNYRKDKEQKVSASLNSDLMKDLEVLADFVEQICEAPESLHLQRNNLVYELVRLVGEDYRLVQYEIFHRVVELGDRSANLNLDELTQSLRSLKRLEDSHEGLSQLFINRKRNDRLWDMINETKIRLLLRKEMMAENRLVKVEARDEVSELTRFREQFSELGQLFRFAAGGKRLELDAKPASIACFEGWVTVPAA